MQLVCEFLGLLEQVEAGRSMPLKMETVLQNFTILNNLSVIDSCLPISDPKDGWQINKGDAFCHFANRVDNVLLHPPLNCLLISDTCMVVFTPKSCFHQSGFGIGNYM